VLGCEVEILSTRCHVWAPSVECSKPVVGCHTVGHSENRLSRGEDRSVRGAKDERHVHEQPPVRDPAASAEDLALTRRLAAAASLLGKYTPSGGASDSTTTPHVLGPSRGDLVRY
jgi:hypothetical protein